MKFTKVLKLGRFCSKRNPLVLIKLSTISILTLVFLCSKSGLGKCRYEELVQNEKYETRHDLGIGTGSSSFNIDTISWITENPSSTAYQTLLIISKTGSGDELFGYFTKNNTKPQGKYGSQEAIVTLKTVLKIRKLILFTVNEINLKLKNQGNCMKFWANPLNIHEIEEIGIKGKPERYYRIQFRIQPGHLVLEASIKEDGDYLNKPFTVGIQNELELISAQLLEMGRPQYRDNSHCIGATAFSQWSELCICQNIQLTQITNEVRGLASIREPELELWPPTAPMLITNYFSYGSPDFYLISPRRRIYHRFCNPNLNFLIVVHSYLYNYEKRMAIRETYGSQDEMKKKNFGLLFFLGRELDTKTIKSLSMEISEFGDIVVGDFVDSYTNLTLKTLSVYNWIYTFCMKTKSLSYPSWILKADDDMLVNVEFGIQIAEANPDIPLLGFVRSGEVRQVSWKWNTPRYLYMADWFPTFHLGVTYMIQTSWIPKYLQASLTTPLLPSIEDVYFTGILSIQLGICPMPFPTRLSFYAAKKSACNLKQSITSIDDKYWNRITPFDTVRGRWEILNSPEGAECKEYFQPKVTEPMTKGSCVFSPMCPKPCRRS